MLEYFNEIARFDAENFHWFRPLWLWGFAPVLLVAILVIISFKENTKWQKVIAPALRPFMITKEKSTAITFPLLSYLLIMSIGILALAGPTWSKQEVPGAKSEAVLMIALDASLSMLAEDIQPNRLERAKYKINDLLAANPGSKVSLYAYAGTAHTVVPMCSDYKLVKHHLESIFPGIMPRRGSNLQHLMQLADSSLTKVKAPSILLIVSDVIQQEDISALTSFVDNSPHQIEILAMATAQGAQIPINKWKHPLKDEQGHVIISKLDADVLFELQNHPKININTLTLDNSDVELMAKKIRSKLNYQEDDVASEEQWKDMGFLLVIILVVLVPFWFRKGWMVNYIWLAFGLSSCSEIDNWNDLWYTKDYQGQQLYEQKNFETAGNTFQSPIHQGVAYFKAGNYDAAAQAFAQDSSANSLYNLGLSYAQMGMYDEALEAIELAAQKEPGNKQYETAINNTHKTIGIIDSLKASGQPIALPEKKKEKEEPLKERKASSKDEELSSDTEVDELPKGGKRVTDEVETDMRKAKELEEVPDNFESGSGDTPQNVLLRGISEDPSEFLRRRFNYQYKKHYQNIEQPKEKW
ncbi:VWA domain-containing protein [Carboxylicivirga sp. A043]|uniref:VWA domain-containing protein n=1 Tax=Carboxylicivirga litoralis TaxID=2816963 RepID=UPI0021CB8AC3|nr:VWA domain-containing protein [Carboxylicivirga sp. A043]MCU4156300.1 VWA domain-containing protein [Carboxylicivirga sp. A043]